LGCTAVAHSLSSWWGDEIAAHRRAARFGGPLDPLLGGWTPHHSGLAAADPALGGAWVPTTAALAGRLEPAARQEIVRRRAEALDELERRDPSGFARWLTVERGLSSDPADFVRGDRTMGTDAA
jgi:hypothetical protein